MIKPFLNATYSVLSDSLKNAKEKENDPKNNQKAD